MDIDTHQGQLFVPMWAINSVFVGELLLAFGIIVFLAKSAPLPKCLRRKRPSSTKICKEPICKKLEETMVDYMKKQLAHEDEEEELKNHGIASGRGRGTGGKLQTK